MPASIQRRRGSTSQHAVFTGLPGEITVDTDKKVLVTHDGITAGGFPGLRQDLSNVTPSAINALVTAPSAITSINGGQLAGMRNRIINGDMRISQRGTSGLAPNGYTLDRWIVGSTGTNVSVAQVLTSGAPGNSFNVLQISGAAGNTLANLQQRIESQNCRDLAGQTVTLSYWVYHNTGSAVSVTSSLSYATATDNWGSATTIGISAGTSVPSGTWTKVSYSVAVPSAATTGLGIAAWSNGTAIGAGQILLFAFAQLELGTVATPFEQIPYGLQLSLCSRYLPVWVIKTGAYNFTGQCFSATDGRVFLPHPVTPRVAPTGISVNPGGVIQISTSNGSLTGTGALNFSSASLAGLLVSAASPAGLVAGNVTTLVATASDSTIYGTGCEL